MLVTAFCGLVAAWSPQGNLADPPVGLTVVVCAVGQGDGIVLRAPDGTVHVVDAGPGGQGTITMLPTIAQLAPSGYGFSFLSHFHEDHLGGLDEVLNALPLQFAYDRGDLNRASGTAINNYLAAAGPRRQQVTLGASYALGGGASVTVIAYDGQVLGGAFVNPTTSAQEENSRSVVLRLEYGLFSMWLGGDLTGGASGTADVESPASLACGDVDVYKLNHHGSASSSNLNLIARLRPELAVVSAGVGNPYGHPTSTAVNRINQAAAARALLSTTTGSANTIGFGVCGPIRIDTDGTRYRATSSDGSWLDFWCDEIQTPPVGPGELRFSEVHRNPGVVPDTNGEYVEVVNVGSRPVGLRGVRLVDGGNTITLASNFLAVPGKPLLFQVDGAPTRNGGQPLGVPMPFGALSIANTTDSLALTQGAVTIDQLTYASGFPGGDGVAAERVDLMGPQSNTNWTAASSSFGAGDRGTPGAKNGADATPYPVHLAVDVVPGKATFHATALGLTSANWSFVVLAYTPGPSFSFGGAVIPLGFDPLVEGSLVIPGLLALMPPGGYRSTELVYPQPSPVPGIELYAVHAVLESNLLVPGVSPALSFVLP